MIKGSLYKNIPNSLSILRIILTIFANILLFFTEFNFFIIFLTLIIFLTDFFDGKIARKLNLSSKFGVFLDVFADLFYIVSTYIILNKLDIAPLWFLSIILFKFFEFLLTSIYLSKFSTKTLIFDPIGRSVAVLFYIYPLSLIITHNFLNKYFNYFYFYIPLLITLLAFTSSIYRLNKIRLLQNKTILKTSS